MDKKSIYKMFAKRLVTVDIDRAPHKLIENARAVEPKNANEFTQTVLKFKNDSEL